MGATGTEGQLQKNSATSSVIPVLWTNLHDVFTHIKQTSPEASSSCHRKYLAHSRLNSLFAILDISCIWEKKSAFLYYGNSKTSFLWWKQPFCLAELLLRLLFHKNQFSFHWDSSISPLIWIDEGNIIGTRSFPTFYFFSVGLTDFSNRKTP